MINLIPIEDKKRMKRDFYFRFFTLLVFMFGIAIVILSIVSLPSFFISQVKKNTADAKLEMQKKEPMPELDQETLVIIKDLKNKIGLIEKAEQNKFRVSINVVTEILSKKMADIKINHISYENDPTKGKTININGLAPSRERLLLFRQMLEEDKAFSKVDLPISNFVKGSDIEFYLNLIPA